MGLRSGFMQVGADDYVLMQSEVAAFAATSLLHAERF